MTDPQWVEPMLAQPLKWPAEASAVRGPGWVYERKLDGLRCIAVRRAHHVELWSRNRLSWNARFPQLATAVAALPVDSVVLDGEVAAFDGERSSFQMLQGGEAGRLAFVVFDVMHLLGHSTIELPLEERTGLLRRFINGESGVIELSHELPGTVDDLMHTACSQGWEGLVAKRLSSPYRAGRSPDWRKLKCTARQELVIGGWTDPSGSRLGFGALLMGYYSDGVFVYAGKVGTGFDDRTLGALGRRLTQLADASNPFATEVPIRGAHWVRPELVAEVAFTEWTRDGRMRHPSFLGLRPDKPASSVVRETPA